MKIRLTQLFWKFRTPALLGVWFVWLFSSCTVLDNLTLLADHGFLTPELQKGLAEIALIAWGVGAVAILIAIFLQASFVSDAPPKQSGLPQR